MNNGTNDLKIEICFILTISKYFTEWGWHITRSTIISIYVCMCNETVCVLHPQAANKKNTFSTVVVYEHRWWRLFQKKTINFVVIVNANTVCAIAMDLKRQICINMYKV